MGRFNIGALTNVEPGNWGGHQVSGHETDVSKNVFYDQLPTSVTIHKWTLAPEVFRFHIGTFTDVERGHWGRHQVSGYGNDASNHVLKSIANFSHNSQVGPSSKVGRFNIGAHTDVEPGHWGGHQVSGHGTDVSNHVL